MKKVSSMEASTTAVGIDLGDRYLDTQRSTHSAPVLNGTALQPRISEPGKIKPPKTQRKPGSPHSKKQTPFPLARQREPVRDPTPKYSRVAIPEGTRNAASETRPSKRCPCCPPKPLH